jgi:hypothetical protein
MIGFTDFLVVLLFLVIPVLGLWARARKRIPKDIYAAHSARRPAAPRFIPTTGTPDEPEKPHYYSSREANQLRHISDKPDQRVLRRSSPSPSKPAKFSYTRKDEDVIIERDCPDHNRVIKDRIHGWEGAILSDRRVRELYGDDIFS